jgi:2'-hydroxyisoflavone reductase
MSTDRRQFIRMTAAAGGALSLGVTPALAGPAATTPSADRLGTLQASRRIRLLILGGTGFIGPYQVRYAVERGHEVTIFNRGSNPDMFPGVEELIGDRSQSDGLAALRGRTWDAVIDNSASNGATAPQWVREAATLLRDNVEQYLFISTRSVYADLSQVPSTVDSPVLTPENSGWTEGRPYSYGLGKALAEKEAMTIFGERSTIVRPGLIVGPDDPTDRFTYWPVRIHRGGEILAPGNPLEDRIQIIDVRDLCEWVVRLCENRTYGRYMGVGPENGRSIAEMLYGIAAIVDTPLSWTWIPLEFLQQHNVRPYQEMPVWMPPTPGREGFAQFDLSREVASGLTFRTLADTAQATLDYHFTLDPERRRPGLTPEREVEVLAAWHASGGG